MEFFPFLLVVAIFGLVGCQKSGGDKKDEVVAPVAPLPPDDSQDLKTCAWNGTELVDGSEVDAYQATSVPFGQSCASERRLCRDGVLSGSFTSLSCAVDPAAACSFGGSAVAHAQSVVAYQTSMVPFGVTCVPETRACNNGTLSGTYTSTSCAVAAPSSCTVAGQTVGHNSSITLFHSAHSNEDGECPTETRSCFNGTLSGTAAETSCAKPTLDDLFSGKAKFQDPERAQEVSFKFEVAIEGVTKQRLGLFTIPKELARYGVVGGSPAADEYALYLVRSEDGREFQQVGGRLFENADPKWIYRNPHVAVDSSSDPVIYVMSLDCAIREKGVESGSSVCVSTSTSPTDASTWSLPILSVENDGAKTASTGVFLIDEGRKFFKWALLDDGNNPYLNGNGEVNPDDGDESASSWASELKSLLDYVGLVSSVGTVLMEAVADTRCQAGWDCNLVDVQDWRYLEKRYYALSSGANYYRCARPESDAGISNLWNVGLRRADEPFGKYDSMTEPLLRLPGKRPCEATVPSFGVGDDQEFLYYTYAPSENESRRLRSRLVWTD